MSVGRYEHLGEIDTYFEEIKKYKPLSKAEEMELAEKIKDGDEESMERLITANLKFVVNIAKSYRYSGVPFSDLISEGNMGLIRAAQKFDGTRNIKFISYAVYWIRNSIQECIENFKNNEMLGDEYIFNTKNELINEEFENKLTDIQSRKTSIDRLLGCLQEREAKILISYFGLSDNKEKTLDEIGSEMNLTMERVRQIKDKAITKLRTEVLMSSEFDLLKSLK